MGDGRCEMGESVNTEQGCLNNLVNIICSWIIFAKLPNNFYFPAGGHDVADHRVGGQGVLRRTLSDAQRDSTAVG